MGENKQKAAADKYKSQKTATIGPRKNNRMIYLNQAAPAFRKIKQRWKMERVQQSGEGRGSTFAKSGIDPGTKLLGSEIGKKINKTIDNIPNIFKFGVSKIKNKNVQQAMASEIANMVVEEVQNKAKNIYTSLFDE